MGIKKSFRPIIENVIAQYLPWAVGGLVLILAWLSQQLQLWQLLLLLLGIIVLVFGGMNQYAGWKERHKKGFSTLGNESMEAMLRQWLDKRGYFSNHQTSEKDLFRFVVTDDQKRPVNIN